MFSFIPMRKALRAVTSVEQVLQALNTAQEMTLAIKDEPYPYAVTVNYAPVVRDDELYLLFHGAKVGRKFTLLKRDPQPITLPASVVRVRCSLSRGRQRWICLQT